jgi:hypothetical protein
VEIAAVIVAFLLLALGGVWWGHRRAVIAAASDRVSDDLPAAGGRAGTRAAGVDRGRCRRCNAVVMEDDSVFCPRCGVRLIG